LAKSFALPAPLVEPPDVPADEPPDVVAAEPALVAVVAFVAVLADPAVVAEPAPVVAVVAATIAPAVPDVVDVFLSLPQAAASIEIAASAAIALARRLFNSMVLPQ
jgi:hypothetical protein